MAEHAGAARAGTWTRIAPIEDLPVDRGVTALVQGQAIAVFRTADGEVFALGNHDPYSRTGVLARGIVGSKEGVPFVASPRHRHPFDLRTGRSLDDAHVRVPAYQVSVIDGVVHVGPRCLT